MSNVGDRVLDAKVRTAIHETLSREWNVPADKLTQEMCEVERETRLARKAIRKLVARLQWSVVGALYKRAHARVFAGYHEEGARVADCVAAHFAELGYLARVYKNDAPWDVQEGYTVIVNEKKEEET